MKTVYSPLIHEALEYAAVKHDGQYRNNPNDIPYISHPADVGLLLSRAGYDDEVIAAGILHDVLEDCGVPSQELEHRFGHRVATLVQHVSEQKEIKNWIERKQRYREGLAQAHVEALAIACADHLHNMHSLHRSMRSSEQKITDFKGISIKDRLDHEEQCLEIFQQRLDQPWVQEFAEIIQTIKQD